MTQDITAVVSRVICPGYLRISSGPCPGYKYNRLFSVVVSTKCNYCRKAVNFYLRDSKWENRGERHAKPLTFYPKLRLILQNPLFFDKKHFMAYQRNISFSYITCPINWFIPVFKIISFTDYLSH